MTQKTATSWREEFQKEVDQLNELSIDSHVVDKDCGVWQKTSGDSWTKCGQSDIWKLITDLVIKNGPITLLVPEDRPASKPPRTIKTESELDAIPYRSIVADCDGDAWQKTYSYGWCLAHPNGREWNLAALLPATVIREGPGDE